MAQIPLNLPDLWKDWLVEDCRRLGISQQKALRDLVVYMVQGKRPAWLSKLRMAHSLEGVHRDPN